MIRALILCALVAGVGGAVETIRYENPKVPDGCRQEGGALICKDGYIERIEKLEKRVADSEQAIRSLLDLYMDASKKIRGGIQPSVPAVTNNTPCSQTLGLICGQTEK